jgi:hypothetical protein
MSIKNFVSTIVSQIQVDNTPFTFAHGESDWQNMMADEQNYPVVYLDEPISNDFLLLNSGAIQEFYPIKLVLLYKTELDFNPDQHDQVIQKARLAARKFISLCANAEEVKEVKNSKGVEIINLFDANTSGMVLNLDLHFYNFEAVCANYTPNTSFTTLKNSADNWSVQVPNGTTYIVPDTFFEIVDQFGVNLGEFEIPSVLGGTVIVNVTPPECLDATIEVNGDTFGTVASGGTIDIPVVNGGSNPVGTIDGGQVVIGDSSVFINGTQVGDVVAEDTLSIAVELDGAPAGTWNAGAQTWEVESIPSPINLTVNSEPFLLGLTSSTNIGLVDQDGNDLDFTVDGLDLVVESIDDLFWTLNFNGTTDVITLLATVGNIGTFTSGSGTNVGTITVSTDGVTYGTLSFPFTPTAVTTYYFKRSTATVSGVFNLIGTY